MLDCKRVRILLIVENPTRMIHLKIICPPNDIPKSTHRFGVVRWKTGRSGCLSVFDRWKKETVGRLEIKSSWWTRYSEDQKLYISSPVLRCFCQSWWAVLSFWGMTLCRRVIGSRRSGGTYEACLESIQPFWKSREPVAWPWFNLAASQRRPYCASVNSHFPVGLVSRQCDAVDLPSVLWPSHSKWPGEQISFITTMRQPILQLSCRLFFFVKASHHPGLSAPLQPRFGSLRLLTFPKAKIARWNGDLWNATVTQNTSSVNGVSLPTD